MNNKNVKLVASEEVFIGEGTVGTIKINNSLKNKNFNFEVEESILKNFELIDNNGTLVQVDEDIITLNLKCINSSGTKGGIYSGTWIKEGDVIGEVELIEDTEEDIKIKEIKKTKKK